MSIQKLNNKCNHQDSNQVHTKFFTSESSDSLTLVYEKYVQL